MIKSKKQMFIVIGVFAVLLMLTTITYAFFNYTRTGVANTIRVGRINFITRQTETINLTNVFPISSAEATGENPNYDEVVIEIVGDTDYVGGIEYLVSAVDANIYTNQGQAVPISLDITIDDDLGTETNNYFTARDNTNTSIYKKLVGKTLVGDQMLLVGYIAPNTNGNIDGIDATLTIKAYLDKNKILISDTYDGTESDDMGTTNNEAEGKIVITTSEWNALQQNGVSFKVKVEANEGIWIVGSLEEIMRKSAVMDNINSLYVNNETPGIDFGAASSDTNGKGVYTRAGTENDDYPIMYYRGEIEDNNVFFANKCWKAVRTTDTGGVKLIYNGEQKDIYDLNNSIERENYTSVQTVNWFSFDASDNSWNITIIDSTNPSIAFNVPAGDNYSLVMTGTSGQTTGGTYNFYKNDTKVYYGSGGGGAPYAYTVPYGTLTASDLIKFEFMGYGTIDSPITFKLIMKQNEIALSREDYTLVMKDYSFDEETQVWSSTVEPNNRATMEFSVSEAGDYFINYTSPPGGPLYIYRNGVEIPRLSSNLTEKLFNLQTTDKIIVDYSQVNTSSTGTMSFHVIKAEKLGIGCENIGKETQITVDDENAFGFSSGSVAEVGYMHANESFAISAALWVSGAKFGNSFTWDGTYYKLTDATVTSPNPTHRYSCNSIDAEATCTIIRYVNNVYNNKNIYVKLENGKSIEDKLRDRQVNIINSNAKSNIEIWYSENMVEMTSKLEDTAWCNDRSFGDEDGLVSNGGSMTVTVNYGAKDRSNLASNTSIVKNKPSLVCKNKNDRFSVNNSVGNSALTYPVALLTEDEVVLAGGLADSSSNNSFYLKTGSSWWTLSPYDLHDDYYGAGFYVYDNGDIRSSNIYLSKGLRPAISLKPGQLITKGTGTVLDPYVIE